MMQELRLSGCKQVLAWLEISCLGTGEPTVTRSVSIPSSYNPYDHGRVLPGKPAAGWFGRPLWIGRYRLIWEIIQLFLGRSMVVRGLSCAATARSLHEKSERVQQK
jgi:hypothetical protein